MTEAAVHATFVIEKTYPKPPAHVFAAFADPALKARWYARNGLDMDFRVGGHERSKTVMGDDTPFPGAILTTEGLWLDIVPDARIVTGSNMAMNGRVFSSSLLTFEFAAEGDGTRLTVTHQGAFFEHADGSDMREHGWRALLDKLGDAL
ncbi:SRPBCC domain-containing protein [Asticcacaulis sp. EMRT-3]|uniref:SRPBCC domain-containing protein n=1 Tax=Asticcacaulis sp. EMRT-3 TaxID=3040349 RepID=UPI0024AECB3B|nr:SRPBCC domain-containing protein [Asticcacaulis sp. EMRT-3]MDI7775164.1 SRPBCC domain-containing protein [Asticcacaulis sp. EMRT-3]